MAVAAAAYYWDKQKKSEAHKSQMNEAQANVDAAKAEAQKVKDEAAATQEQQDAVRKKLASLGRIQNNTAFDDGSGQASTKVFS